MSANPFTAVQVATLNSLCIQNFTKEIHNGSKTNPKINSSKIVLHKEVHRVVSPGISKRFEDAGSTRLNKVPT